MLNQRENIDKNVKHLYLLIVLIPIWWILGIKFFVFHITILLIFVSFTVKKGPNSKINTLHTMILLYFISIYSLSIIINFNLNEFERFIATTYNLTYYVLGYMLIVILININWNKNNIIFLLSGIRLFGLIQGVLGVIFVMYWYVSTLPIASLNSVLATMVPSIKNFGLLYSSTTIYIVKTDWLNGEVWPRMAGFFAYPTALGIGMVFVIFISIVYYNEVRISKIRIIIELLIMLVPLIYSLSRVSIAAMLVSFIAIYFYKYVKEKLYITLSISCFSIAGFLLLSQYYLNLSNFIDYILSSRSGSTDLRNNVYLLAIKAALESPFVGVAIKFEEPGIPIPIGSHSTYIGLFLKTGLLGLLSFLIFKIMIIVNWVKFSSVKIPLLRNLWLALGGFFIAISIWMLTEDIDAPQIVAYFYFLTCGLILSLNRMKDRIG